MIGINHVISFCQSLWAEALAACKSFCSRLWVLFLVLKNQEAVEPLRGTGESGCNNPSALVTLMCHKAFSAPQVAIFLLTCQRPEPYLLIDGGLISSAYFQLLQWQLGDHGHPMWAPLRLSFFLFKTGCSVQRGVLFSVNAELFAGSLAQGGASRCPLVSLFIELFIITIVFKSSLRLMWGPNL